MKNNRYYFEEEKMGGVRLKNKKKGRKGNMDQRCVDGVKSKDTHIRSSAGVWIAVWQVGHHHLDFSPFFGNRHEHIWTFWDSW